MTIRSLRFFVLAFLLCFSGNIYAQTWQWAKTSGNTADDAPNSMAVDPSGNIITVGYYTNNTISFGSTLLTNAGSSDLFIVKHDPSGNVIWAKSAGGTGLDRAFAVTTDTAGHIYVAGYFASASINLAGVTINNLGSGIGNLDMFVAELDATGNAIWAKSTMVAANNVEAHAIAIDNSGNVYVTGYFGSPSLTIGSTMHNNSGGFPTNDAFVAKYNGAGVFQWVNKIGGADFEEGYGICTDKAGNVYVGGDFRSAVLPIGSTTLNVTSAGYFDGFLAKYDPSGNAMWAKKLGGSSHDQTQTICSDSSNHIYVAGVFQSTTISFGSSTLTNAGDNDPYLAKYDSAGNELWALSEGGANYDGITCVKADPAGNVFITGYFFSPSITFGTTTLTNSSTANLYLVKLDSAGSAIWAQSNDSGMVGGAAVAPDKFGNVYVSGTHSGQYCKFDTITLFNNGLSSNSEIFIAKYGFPVTSVNAIQNEEYSVQLYPNPNFGVFALAVKKGAWTSVSVYNKLGALLYSDHVDANKDAIELNLSDLPTDIYYLRLHGSEGSTSMPFMKN